MHIPEPQIKTTIYKASSINYIISFILIFLLIDFVILFIYSIKLLNKSKEANNNVNEKTNLFKNDSHVFLSSFIIYAFILFFTLFINFSCLEELYIKLFGLTYNIIPIILLFISVFIIILFFKKNKDNQSIFKYIYIAFLLIVFYLQITKGFLVGDVIRHDVSNVSSMDSSESNFIINMFLIPIISLAALIITIPRTNKIKLKWLIAIIIILLTFAIPVSVNIFYGCAGANTRIYYLPFNFIFK